MKISYKKFSLIFLLLFNFTHVIPACALPKEIILIRHADKLNQLDPGPFLSLQGVKRANFFSQYYLTHFREPDYIITTAQTRYSYRELQTVIPLVTTLSISHPNGGQPILLSDQYLHEKTLSGLKNLTNDLLNDKKFNKKTILICWHHAEIPLLLSSLGVTPTPSKLADDDYDTVYHLLFDSRQGMVKLIVLSPLLIDNTEPSESV